MSNTRKKRVSRMHLQAHKRPWKVTYRNKNGDKTVNILKNGTKKNKLLKQINHKFLQNQNLFFLVNFEMI